MRYMGSKARFSSEILPIILEGRSAEQYYVEPFCGGCNVIDKVEGNRIANDGNPYLISMWRSLVNGWTPPTTIDHEFYSSVRECYNKQLDSYTSDLIGWVGFMGSYNGRFFDGGYSGHSVALKNGATRDYIGEAVNNILRQVSSLQGTTFVSTNYKNLVLPSCSIIYCDPPYEGVKKYNYSINHKEFWGWCRLKVEEGHRVFISEYNAPEDFTCVWEQAVKTSINPAATKHAVEKLFIHKSQI